MIDLSVGSSVVPSVRLVIFDKDGTLIELHHYWSEMVRLRARLICEALGLDDEHELGLRWVMGADASSGRLSPEEPVGLKKREIVMKAATDYLDGIGRRDTTDVCTRAFADADDRSSEDLAHFIRPIEGAASLIAALRTHGCHVALATVDLSVRARLAMDFMGLQDSFDLVVGGDHVSRSKPDPEMVHLALRRLDIDAAHAVMIGDAVNDVQMGVNAGLAASIGVLTGFASAAEMRAVTPFVAPSVADLGVRQAAPRAS